MSLLSLVKCSKPSSKSRGLLHFTTLASQQVHLVIHCHVRRVEHVQVVACNAMFDVVLCCEHAVG